MKRKIAFLLTLAFLIVGYSGCGANAKKTKGDKVTSSYGTTYPLETNGEVLSMWVIHSVHPEYKSYQDVPFYQELQKRTGVTLDIQGPTGGQFAESFNLMIASGDLPDLIKYDWAEKKVAGGPEKYIKEKYIIALNDVIDAYAPNLKKVLKENPDIDKAVKTDQGNYYVFPTFTGGNTLSWGGPAVRQDWLEELGMELPETIDDWHNMLTRFKNEKNSTSPLFWIDWLLESSGFLSGAYGEIMGYYIDENNKVTYGPANPGWKEYLRTMNQWYKEGLIDKDIATLDVTGQGSRILSGKNGAFLTTGASLGAYIPQMQELDPKAKFVGVPYPVLNKGDKPKFGVYDLKYTGLGSIAISAECKDLELAAKFLDYLYTDEGRMLGNFGIEGETYNMVDGHPVLTDKILKSDNIEMELKKYAMGEFTVKDTRAYQQTMVYPEQNAAIETWSKTEAQKHKMPILLPTEEESNKIAGAVTEIETYVDEMLFKFILGSESLDNFDNYVAHLKELGLEEVLSVYQGLYDRYQQR